MSVLLCPCDGLTYDPIVCEALARCYRTLSGSTRAIHVICASLMNAVPVERCALVAQTVVDVYNHTISLHDIDGWAWPVNDEST